MKHLTYFFLCLASAGFAQTPITDANFYEAISTCLSTNPVDGLCYDSEYGAMPDWDVSQVTSMYSAFVGYEYFNGDISSWDVSNVTNMEAMFRLARSFNRDIGNWDVSNVTNMNAMFRSTDAFNQEIGEWNVGKVTDMGQMFYQADGFNQKIGDWDVSSVVDMRFMFGNGSPFNQDIGAWDVGNVTNMEAMFSGASAFNQNISSWDVSNVLDMSSLFGGSAFDQDISSWDVSSVLDMSYMFASTPFNQDISSWDVSNVANMTNMFWKASLFNQNIGIWDVSTVSIMTEMFSKSNLSTENYDAILQGWSTQNLQSDVNLGAEDIYYCNSEEERQSLIDDFGWTILDEGPDLICILPITICQDITVTLDLLGSAVIEGLDVDNGSTDVSGSTNLIYQLSQTTFSCSDLGQNYVILTVTDSLGYQNNCSAIVSVVDDVEPIAICKDATVGLGFGGIVSLNPYIVNDNSSDNCSLASLEVNHTAFNCNELGQNTVNLTVADISGNQDSCSSIVTVVDNTNPTAVCQDIAIELDDDGVAYLFPPDIDGGSFDNCALSYLEIDQSTFDCSSPTLNNVTLTAFDESGNTNTCTSVVIVEGPDEPLVITQTEEACGFYYWSVTDEIYFESELLTETSANGSCDTVFVLNLLISEISDMSIIVNSGSVSTNNNTASYQWLDCDNDYAPVLGATNQSYSPTIGGSFALELTEGGCVDTTACVSVIPTSTSDIQNNILGIYPNPTKGKVNINLDSASKGVLKTYDIQGRLIHCQAVQSQENLDYIIEGESGLYLIEFIDERGEEVFVGRVLKVD